MKIKGKSKLLAEGEFYPIKSLIDEEILQIIKNYRKQVASRYQAVTSSNMEMVLTHSPFKVSPKIDGELWFMVIEPDASPVLCSSNGRVISGSLPVLDEVLNLKISRKDRIILAGELYVLAEEGRSRVGMVSSMLASGKKAEVDRLGFMIFDLVEADNVPDDYDERHDFLAKLFEKGKRCQFVKTEICEDINSVQQLYDKWVEGGKAEGLIVRDSIGSIAKMKPTFTFDVAVVAFTDRSEFPDQVGSVMMGLRREDGSYQIVGGCGNLGNPSQRRSLRKTLINTTVDTDMRHASGSGALYRFVEPKLVVEVVVTDVQAETADGGFVQNRILNYSEGSGWETIQYLPGASLIHASMVRIRDDKTIEVNDVRLSQLTERCYLESLDKVPEKSEMPSSKVIRREVYVKKTKGLNAVRKLLMWQTNKEEKSPDYPAFVVHFTDYSPSRKDPLKREVRIAPTEELAKKIAEQLLEKNIKKGWDRADK